MNDDDSLIDDALSGNSAAFGQLVQRYQDRLFTAVAYALGSPEDARDVVQEAFVHAFCKLETFQRHSRFYTWLYRIAFNSAVSLRRRRRPTQSLDGAREAAGMEPADPGRLPEDGLESKERVNQVRAALAVLSEEHRTVLVLREMDGHDYDTIAEMLDLPVGTVRSRLHRARSQLREQLKEVAHEGLA